MTENEKLLSLLQIQRANLEELLNNGREKYSQSNLDSLQAEIDTLDARINIYKGEM